MKETVKLQIGGYGGPVVDYRTGANFEQMQEVFTDEAIFWAARSYILQSAREFINRRVRQGYTTGAVEKEFQSWQPPEGPRRGLTEGEKIIKKVSTLKLSEKEKDALRGLL